MNDFQPNWVSAPGETINDIMRIRGLREVDLANSIGQTENYIRDLLDGRAAITVAVAQGLSQALGGSPEFWMARDSQYRQDAARIQSEGRDWLRSLPLSDMIRLRWLPRTPAPLEELSACLSFFNVSSIREWYYRYDRILEAVAFRTSPTYDSDPAAVAAWLRQGEIEAEAVKCAPWNVDLFLDHLSQVRELTREKEPSVFLPRLVELCRAAGVAVVVVRAPKGCRASGATKFMQQGKAILLLSFRFLSDDHFWFTFFHEAGHLVLHGTQGLFIEGLEAGNEELEEEANDFAERTLLPGDLRQELRKVEPKLISIMRFAKRAGVSPGVVVGQLQHHGIIPRKHFNNLKIRYSWSSEE